MNRRAVLVGGGALVLAGGVAAASYAGIGSTEDYARAIAAQRAPLASEGGAREAIRFATLAASGHNTQPWRFHTAPNVIRITPDMSRRTPIVDPDDHHMYVSLGCALENMSLAAASLGLPGKAHYEPDGEGAIMFEYVSGVARPSDLSHAISRRQSSRIDYDGRAVSAGDLAQLTSAAAMPGVDVALLTERSQTR